ncbi:NAD(P)-binding domain-containing protein [Streptomyces sp. NPDC059373]
MTTIGFVGLGAMGGRMAGRLVAAGHEVYGTNRTASKAAGPRSAMCSAAVSTPTT